MESSPRPWGQHLVLDFGGCPPRLLTNPRHLRAWVSELVRAIDMRAYGEPVIEHFATDSYESAGFTLLQLIETSNVCAHFAENLGQAYIDIFSCKAFDETVAESVCKRYFEPAVVRRTGLVRGAFAEALACAG